jgi:SAM-dependent methyltransferase
MALDVVDLRSFYGTPLGHVTRRILTRAIRSLWPSTSGLSVAGFGYATPCLTPFRGEAERVFALMPAAQGVVNWPADGQPATALAHSDELPLPNASIDRVLLIHSIETMSQPIDLLNEVWRVLTPGGRVIAVVPNRRGLWARRDITPFGHGQPFSRGQLAQLMRLALFSPENWTEALYVPPSQRRLVLRAAMVLERVGEKLSLPFSGVHVVDATKQLYRPAPARAARRGFVMATPEPVATRDGLASQIA